MIQITNMKYLPTDCFSCRLSFNGFCPAADRKVFAHVVAKTKHPECPLKEVPNELEEIKSEIANELQILDICNVQKSGGVIVQSESAGKKVVKYDAVMKIIDRHIKGE